MFPFVKRGAKAHWTKVYSKKLNTVISRDVKTFPCMTLFLKILIKTTGEATAAIAVKIQRIVQEIEHSIPNNWIPCCRPNIMIAVNPGIKIPAIQNFNVGFIKLNSYAFFIAHSNNPD